MQLKGRMSGLPSPTPTLNTHRNLYECILVNPKDQASWTGLTQILQPPAAGLLNVMLPWVTRQASLPASNT